MATILLVGVSDVGSHILEFAARDDSDFEWIIGDVNEERAILVSNNAEIGAAHHGTHPPFRPMQIDLFEIGKTADLIHKEKPTAVINCTVLHTWHLIRQLPEDLYLKISSAGLGAWLPCQLTLGMNLAQAIKDSGWSLYYINEESGRLDSIEEIQDDGTVVLTDYAYETMKETLGFDCRLFKPSESKDVAIKQMACYKNLAEKHIRNYV